MSNPRPIPVRPFQERAIELVNRGWSWSEIAYKSGLTRTRYGRLKGDTSRLKRMIGLYPQKHGSINIGIEYKTAERLARAMDMDPHEAGL